MLKIYDKKEDVPETLFEHYQKRSDGKYEPQIEGINSILGLANKRDELLTKVAEIPSLKTRIAELEGLETLPEGKVAVDKKDFDQLSEYKALGEVKDIKPKLEKHDEVVARDEQRTRAENYRAVAKSAGFTNEDGFLRLAEIERLEPVLKTVNENGKAVEKYFVKTKSADGKETETAITDYVKESPTFKPFADSLTGTQSEGKKVFQQRAGGSAAHTLDDEVKAQQSTGIYGL